MEEQKQRVVIITGGNSIGAKELIRALDNIATVEAEARDDMRAIELRACHDADFPKYSLKDLKLSDDGRKYGKQYRRDIRRGNR